MFEKTEGYIIRKTVFRNTSLIIDILTERFGRMAFVAKGAKNEKSPFLGTLELFNHIAVVFRHSESTDLQTIRSADIITDAMPVSQTMKTYELAGEAAVLVRKYVPEHEPNPNVFRAFDIMMKGFLQGKETKAFLYFLIKLADALGWPLNAGTQCGCGSADALPWFNHADGRFSCDRCRNGVYAGDLYRFAADIAAGNARNFVLTDEEFTLYKRILIEYFSVHTR